MQRLIWILFAILPGLAAVAASADDLGRNFEASMVITGTITVTPDGSVNSYTLDQKDKLSPAVIKVTDATVPNWKFRPVLDNGKPVSAMSVMSLRIVAHPIDEQHATVRVSGADFGRDAEQDKESKECQEGRCLTAKRRPPPAYPIEGLRQQVSGIVYLIQQIGRDGHVERQAIRQVNLRTRFSADVRKAFAEASLKAGKDWTYSVPITGEEAKRDHWIVTVPVDFTLGGDYGYGQWEPYIPGPVQDIPWAKDDANRAASNGSSDAIPDGRAFVADSRFVLLTPPSPG